MLLLNHLSPITYNFLVLREPELQLKMVSMQPNGLSFVFLNAVFYVPLNKTEAMHFEVCMGTL